MMTATRDNIYWYSHLKSSELCSLAEVYSILKRGEFKAAQRKLFLLAKLAEPCDLEDTLKFPTSTSRPFPSVVSPSRGHTERSKFLLRDAVRRCFSDLIFLQVERLLRKGGEFFRQDELERAHDCFAKIDGLLNRLQLDNFLADLQRDFLAALKAKKKSPGHEGLGLGLGMGMAVGCLDLFLLSLTLLHRFQHDQGLLLFRRSGDLAAALPLLRRAAETKRFFLRCCQQAAALAHPTAALSLPSLAGQERDGRCLTHFVAHFSLAEENELLALLHLGRPQEALGLVKAIRAQRPLLEQLRQAALAAGCGDSLRAAVKRQACRDEVVQLAHSLALIRCDRLLEAELVLQSGRPVSSQAAVLGLRERLLGLLASERKRFAREVGRPAQPAAVPLDQYRPGPPPRALSKRSSHRRKTSGSHRRADSMHPLPAKFIPSAPAPAAASGDKDPAAPSLGPLLIARKPAGPFSPLTPGLLGSGHHGHSLLEDNTTPTPASHGRKGHARRAPLFQSCELRELGELSADLAKPRLRTDPPPAPAPAPMPKAAHHRRSSSLNSRPISDPLAAQVDALPPSADWPLTSPDRSSKPRQKSTASDLFSSALPVPLPAAPSQRELEEAATVQREADPCGPACQHARENSTASLATVSLSCQPPQESQKPRRHAPPPAPPGPLPSIRPAPPTALEATDPSPRPIAPAPAPVTDRVPDRPSAEQLPRTVVTEESSPPEGKPTCPPPAPAMAELVGLSCCSPSFLSPFPKKLPALATPLFVEADDRSVATGLLTADSDSQTRGPVPPPPPLTLAGQCVRSSAASLHLSDFSCSPQPPGRGRMSAREKGRQSLEAAELLSDAQLCTSLGIDLLPSPPPPSRGPALAPAVPVRAASPFGQDGVYLFTDQELSRAKVPAVEAPTASDVIEAAAVHWCEVRDFFPYEQLRAPGPYPAAVDVRRREQHLSPAEFVRVFGVGKEAFFLLPAWKQKLKKKALQLF